MPAILTPAAHCLCPASSQVENRLKNQMVAFFIILKPETKPEAFYDDDYCSNGSIASS